MDAGWKEEPMQKQVESPEEPQPVENPCLSIFVFLKDCIPWEKAHARAEGILSRQELWRGAVLDQSQLPLLPWGSCGNLGWWGTVMLMGEGSKGLAFFVSAPHYLSLINSKLHLFPSHWVCSLAVVIVYQFPCLCLWWNLALKLGLFF